MNLKILIPIIAMVSVLLMFVLNAVGFAQSWLAVFAGGIAITIVSMLMHNKKDDGDGDK